MKIVYADMSIDEAKFHLSMIWKFCRSLKNGHTMILDTSFGVSTLRDAVRKMEFSSFDDSWRVVLTNCPLAVDMIANEVRSEDCFDSFKKSFHILDSSGNLLEIEYPTTSFTDLVLSGAYCAKA